MKEEGTEKNLNRRWLCPYREREGSPRLAHFSLMKGQKQSLLTLYPLSSGSPEGKFDKKKWCSSRNIFYSCSAQTKRSKKRSYSKARGTLQGFVLAPVLPFFEHRCNVSSSREIYQPCSVYDVTCPGELRYAFLCFLLSTIKL
jgi:hypothetical protein